MTIAVDLGRKATNQTNKSNGYGQLNEMAAIAKNERNINSLDASSDFCHLLITFANSLDPDQYR